MTCWGRFQYRTQYLGPAEENFRIASKILGLRRKISVSHPISRACRGRFQYQYPEPSLWFWSLLSVLNERLSFKKCCWRSSGVCTSTRTITGGVLGAPGARWGPGGSAPRSSGVMAISNALGELSWTLIFNILKYIVMIKKDTGYRGKVCGFYQGKMNVNKDFVRRRCRIWANHTLLHTLLNLA